MSKFDSGRASNIGGINIKLRRDSDLVGIRFDADRGSVPNSANDFILYRHGSALKLWDGSSTTTLAAGGGAGATPTWETLFAADATFTLNSGTWTLAGNHADAVDVLTLTNIAGGSGDVIQITNSGTGNDIQGTSNTWKVTKAGVATFAGTSISGTTAAMVSTGAADWTIKDADAAALTILPSGGPNMLNFDTSDAAEVLSTDATIFKVSDGKTNLISSSNTAPTVLIENDTVTTFGNGTTEDEGVVVISSDTLTTGDLVRLQLDESALNGGAFIKCLQTDAGAAKFTVAENGVTTIAGTAGSNSFTLTAGDVAMSDGSITVADADNAATLSVTNDTATTASVFVLAGSGAFTGSTTTSFLTLTPSGLTSGTAFYLPVAALTTGKAIHVVANAVTSGIVAHIASSAASTQLTGAGRLLKVDHTGNATGTGILSEFNSAAADETTIVKITASAALALGVALDISAAALTTGKVIDMSDLDAITTGKAIHVDATGTTQTDGILVHIDSASTNLTATGRLLLVDHTGNAGDTAAVIAEVASAATDETTILKVTASAALALGTAVNVSAASLTTGTGIKMSNLNALTSGIGLHIASSATAITGAGRLVYVNHTGATGSSGTLFEVASAANDETVVFKLTGSAALAGGVLCDISAAAMTTGTALDLGNLDALTTGIGINVVMNSSDTGAHYGLYVKNDHSSATGAICIEAENDSTGDTVVIDHNGITGKALYIDAESTTQTGGVVDIDLNTVTTGTGIDIGNADALTTGKILNLVSNSSDTGTRSLVFIKNTHTSASAATPLEIDQRYATSTNYFRIAKYTSSSGTVTLWIGNGTTANGTLSGTAGDILLNGGSNKPEYCTGTTNWTALV